MPAEAPQRGINPTVAPYNLVVGSNQDQSAAVNAAIATAIALNQPVLWPPGHIRLERTVTVNADGLRYAGVSLLGCGPKGTIFDWYGATDGTAITIKSQKQFKLADFTVSNKVAKGTTRGIFFTGASGSGTQVGSAEVSHVQAENFGTGIQVGDAAYAGSEITFYHPMLRGNGIGLDLQNTNTLTIVLHNPELGSNGIGVRSISAGCIKVYGGGGGGNTGFDFDLGAGQGNKIDGYRTEGSNRFLRYTVGGAAYHLTLIDCTINESSNPDRILIETGNGNVIEMMASRINGQIWNTTTQNSIITMISNTVGDTQLIHCMAAGQTFNFLDINNALVNPTTGAGLSGGGLRVGGLVDAGGNVIPRFNATPAGVAFNGVPIPTIAQPSVGEAAIDLPTAIALLNKLRAWAVTRGDVRT